MITCIANHSTGGSFQLFEDKKLVWDRFRGRLLPEEDRVEVRDLAGLDELASVLFPGNRNHQKIFVICQNEKNKRSNSLFSISFQ